MADRKVLKLVGGTLVGAGVLGAAAVVYAAAGAAITSDGSGGAAFEDSTLTCTVEPASGQAVTSINWYDSDPASGSPTPIQTTAFSSAADTVETDTLDISAFQTSPDLDSGDTVYCRGVDDGPNNHDASIAISNSAPVAATPGLSSASNYVQDIFTCAPSATDINEDDSLTHTYAWYVGTTSTFGSATLGTGSSAALSAASVGASKGDYIFCQATTSDGTASDSAESAGILVVNTPPEVSAVTATDTGGADGTATCSWTYADDDSDGQTSASVEWFYKATSGASYSVTPDHTSTVSGTATSDTIDLSSTTGGDINGVVKGGQLMCEVTVNDGTDDSAVGSSGDTTVDNTAPTVSGVGVTGTSPGVGDTITCSWSYADGDSDAQVSASVDWFYNSTSGTVFSGSSTTQSVSGASTSKTTTPTAIGASEGDFIGCEVTVNDGTDNSASANGGALEVQNTLPSASGVSVGPASSTVADTLTCNYVLTDPDTSDPDNSTFVWKVAGSAVAGETSSTALASALQAAPTSGGEAITCEVTPTDDDGAGTTVASGSFYLDNTDPIITGPNLSATTVTSGSTLTCSATIQETDYESWSWAMSWVDGSGSTISGTSGTSGSKTSAATVPDTTAKITANVNASNPVYVCKLTVTDIGGSTNQSASASFSNTAPVASSVALSSTAPQVDDTVTCSWTYTDADSDNEGASEVAWKVNGTTQATDTASSGTATGGSNSVSRTMRSLLAAKGSSVTCEVTPKDSNAASGSAVTSSAATVQNTAPVASSVGVSPTAPEVNDSVSCTYTWSDADDFGTADTDSGTTFKWYVNGGLVTSATSQTATAAGLGTDYGTGSNTLSCEVTPSDGSLSGTAVGASTTATVANTDPVATAAITSGTYATGDTVPCSVSGQDDNAQVVSGVVEWFVGGSSTASQTSTLLNFTGGPTTSATASSDSYVIQPSDAGQSIVCKVTYTDAAGATGTAQDSVSAANSAPVISGIGISPSTAATGDTLTCTASVTESDSDSVSVNVNWTSGSTGGTVLSSSSSSFTGPATDSVSDTYTLLGTDVETDVYCVVTANDGTDSDTANTFVHSDNTTPTLSAVVSSGGTSTGSVLTCTGTVTDPDSQTLSWTSEWRRGSATGNLRSSGSGTLSAPATGSTFSDTYTLTASDVASGQDIYCVLEIQDDEGATASDTSIVSPTATVPQLTSGPTLSPSSPKVDEILTCTAVAEDVDEQQITLTYTWNVTRVNTLSAANFSTSSTLVGGAGASSFGGSKTLNLSTGNDFSKNDIVQCTAQPQDAGGAGSAASASVTLANTLPVLSAAAESSSDGTSTYFDSIVTMSYNLSDWDDVDLDSPHLVDQRLFGYEVLNGGTSLSSSTTTATSATIDLSSYSVSRGDTLTFCYTPNDSVGDGTGPSCSNITVDNKPPAAPNIEIDWLANAAGGGTKGATAPRPAKDDLICQPLSTEPVVDDDGDNLTAVVAWYHDADGNGVYANSELVSNPNIITYSPTSGWTGSISDNAVDGVSEVTVEGEIYACELYYTDGTDVSGTVSTSITIGTDCDVDNDGFASTSGTCGGTDCNDGDPAIFPGAAEIVGDTIDQDCDSVDECYLDNDGDGYAGSASVTKPGVDLACSGPYETNDVSVLDCDDDAFLALPGGTEICDGLDNDCVDGVPDDEIDQDGDFYVECGEASVDCEDWAAVDSMNGAWTSTWNKTDSSGGMVDANGNVILGGCDCNDNPADADASKQSPGLVEECELGGVTQIDSDCDGDPNTDSGVAVSDGDEYFRDADGDGFGDATDSAEFCVLPSGYATNSMDCDDRDSLVNPKAAESCNGRDDDCDGSVDNNDYDSLDENSGCLDLYLDNDKDGYADVENTICLCSTGEDSGVEDVIQVTLGSDRYISRIGDCWDYDPDIYPDSGDNIDLIDRWASDPVGYNADFDSEGIARTEVMDGHDNNCDGLIPLIELDCDGDGSFAMLPTDDAPSEVSRYDEVGLAPCWDEQAGLDPEDPQLDSSGEPLTLPDITCGGADLTLTCDPYTRLWVVDYQGVEAFDGGYNADLPSDVAEGDCDDLCDQRFPGNPEVCDGMDNNCTDDAPNSDDATPYYADPYNPQLAERLWDEMDRDGVPDAMDSRIERIGTVTENEFDLDQDGYIGCGTDIGSLREQTIPTSASCIEDFEDDIKKEDCNNTCALSTPVATEACNGFADTCVGDSEGSDADIDDAIACGIGSLNSGASLEEEVFLLAYIQDAQDDPSEESPSSSAPQDGRPQGDMGAVDTGWFLSSRRSNFDIVECDPALMSEPLAAKDVSPLVPMLLPRAVAPGDVEDWEIGPDDIVETDQLLKQNLNALVGDESVDQAVRDLEDRLAGRLSDRDPLLDFCACVNGFESGERDCDEWRDVGRCAVVKVTLDPSADEDIDLEVEENDCVSDYPEQVITRSVWNPTRILESRQRVVEWECLQLYGMTCTEIAQEGRPDTINFGGATEDCENGVDDDADGLTDCDDPECTTGCLSDPDPSDWWLELDRHTVELVKEGNLMGCWGDPTEGVERITSATGGDCDNADSRATRYNPEGPGDLYGRFWNMELDCSTCLDGVDNNCDGQTDCADPGCAACFVGQGFGVGGGSEDRCAQAGCSSTGLNRSQTLGGIAFAFLAFGLVGGLRRRRRPAA
ncbi:MAG: MopE-related protein [Myxococcota bacterium]|nr:MopE-related protein [Myxococcota bacterium]